MEIIKYRNTEGDEVNIGPFSPYYLIDMEGFGAVQNTIVTQKYYDIDGEAPISERLESRDMRIEGTVVRNQLKSLAEDRKELTRIFNPKVAGTIFYNIFDKQYSIDVLVNLGPVFRKGPSQELEEFEIRLMALDPYWTDKSEIDAEIPMTGEENLFEFPLEITDNFEFSRLIAGDVIEIHNNGDVAVGAVFTINVNGILVNPKLYNVITQEYFALNGTFTNGTRLRISTLRGKKRVEQDDGDGWYNITMKRKVESKFLQIERGVNYLQLQADEGVDFTTSYIRFEPKILGV